jgi:hypothetical protein
MPFQSIAVIEILAYYAVGFKRLVLPVKGEKIIPFDVDARGRKTP